TPYSSDAATGICAAITSPASPLVPMPGSTTAPSPWSAGLPSEPPSPTGGVVKGRRPSTEGLLFVCAGGVRYSVRVLIACRLTSPTPTVSSTSTVHDEPLHAMRPLGAPASVVVIAASSVGASASSAPASTCTRTHAACKIDGFTG